MITIRWSKLVPKLEAFAALTHMGNARRGSFSVPSPAAGSSSTPRLVQRQLLAIQMSNVCGYVLPDFILSALDFFKLPPSPSVTQNTLQPQLVPGSSTNSGSSVPSNMDQLLNFDLVVSNCHVIFAENSCDPNSRGLAAMFDINFSVQSSSFPNSSLTASTAFGRSSPQPSSRGSIDLTHARRPSFSSGPPVVDRMLDSRLVIALGVKGLRTFVCSAAHPVEDGSTAMIRPCDLNSLWEVDTFMVRTDKSNDKGQPASAPVISEEVQRRLGGKMDQMEIRLSHESIRLLKSILDSFLSAQDNLEQLDEEENDRRLLDLALSHRGHSSSLSSTPFSDSAQSRDSSPIHSQPPSPSFAAAGPIQDLALLPQPIVDAEDSLPVSSSAKPIFLRSGSDMLPSVKPTSVETCHQTVNTNGEFELVGLYLVIINDSLGRLLPLLAVHVPSFKLLASDRAVRVGSALGLPTPAPSATEDDWSLISSHTPPLSRLPSEASATYTHTLELQSDLKLQANFYNPKNARWDLLIEETKMVVSAAWASSTDKPSSSLISPDDSKPSSCTVGVRFPNGVGMNCSYDFVVSALETLSEWKTDSWSSSTPSSVSRQFYPFYIRNDTGAPLHFWFGKKPPQFDANTTVQTDTEIPLNVELLIPDFLTRELAGDPMLDMSLLLVDEAAVDGKGWEPVDRLNITRVRCTAVLLVHSASRLPQSTLEISVSLREGSKLVCVRTMLKISNHTNIDLEFKAGGLSVPAEQDRVLGPLKPGGTCFVPTWRGGGWSAIFCRPAGFGALASWSSSPIAGITQRREQQEELLLKCAVEQSALFILVRSQLRPTHSHCFDVDIFPPITLRNLFPLRLDYVIGNSLNPNLRISGRLEAGQEAKILQIGSGSQLVASRTLPASTPFLQISFKLQGYTASTSQPFRHVGDSVEMESEIEMLATSSSSEPSDSKTHASTEHPAGAAVSPQFVSKSKRSGAKRQHRPFLVSISNEAGPCGSRVLSMYAKVWLINNTELSLLYGVSRQRRIVPVFPAQHKGLCVLDVVEPEQSMATGTGKGGQIYLGSPGYQYSRSPISLNADRAVLDGVVSLAARVKDPFRLDSKEVNPADRPARTPFYEIAVQFDRPLGRFAKTRVVTFLPRFVVLNTLSFTMQMMQADAPVSTPLATTWLLPGVDSCFSWFSHRLPPLVRRRM